MHRASAIRIASRMIILVVLLSALWLVSPRPAATQTGAILLPVSVQNLSEAGTSSVELHCENARLSTPNHIEKLSCVLKNNTDRPIVAGTLVIKITVEQRGTIETISSYDSFDTLIHPDLHRERGPNFIAPQEDYVIDQLPTGYGDGVVKQISESIDYIEFTSGQPVGPNVAGSRIINNVREGAAKYRDWLIREFRRNGMSAARILETLSLGDVEEPALDLRNSDQKTGANLFRKFLLRTYASKGEAELLKHIK